MNEIKNAIWNIGNKIVKCNRKCDDVKNDKNDGIIPRCLYLEIDNRMKNAKGCVVVGMNPGKASKKEKNFYKENKLDYHTLNRYWEENASKNMYYNYLRDFINCIGYEGPILWTELAKCQNDDNISSPRLQTFRTCISLFLNRELNIIPNDWPLIGIGREAYKALSYIYPEKKVLGIPHPTGGYGHFHRLFQNKNRNYLKHNIKTKINTFNSSNGAITIWLS